jgi:hypothetical protein
VTEIGPHDHGVIEPVGESHSATPPGVAVQLYQLLASAPAVPIHCHPVAAV